MNRAKRRAETRKQQREARHTGTLHPRSLARAVCHNRMAREEMSGVNKVKADGSQSAFARTWRQDAVIWAADCK